jgi:hypothetical protein
VAVLLFASFVAYDRERSRRLTTSPEHVERLRKVATNLRDQIRVRKARLDYTDGEFQGLATLRAIFRSHGPVLAQQLDEYESGPQLQAQATQAVLDFVAREAERLQLSTADAQRTNQAAKAYMDQAKRSAEIRFTVKGFGGSTSLVEMQFQTYYVNTNPISHQFWNGQTAKMPDLTPMESLLKTIPDTSEYKALLTADNFVATGRHDVERSLDAILGKEGFPGACTDICRQLSSA